MLYNEISLKFRYSISNAQHINKTVDGCLTPMDAVANEKGLPYNLK